MILLDTDVLIDIALDRHPHSAPASELLDRIEHGAEAAFIAWHSISNFYYIVSPALGGVSARDFIVELTRFVAVATTDTESIRYAAELPMADFEDAMQVAAARACGARHIITRNGRDYARSPNSCGRSPGCAQQFVLMPNSLVRLTLFALPNLRTARLRTMASGGKGVCKRRATNATRISAVNSASLTLSN